MMRHRRLAAVVLVSGSILCGSARAGDWPLYRGPHQDGISPESVNSSWGADGPKVMWNIPVNSGLSSFAVSGGKAYTLAVRQIDGQPREVCLALDAASGKEAWIADLAVGKGYSGAGEGDGPRCTPTINDGRLYVLVPDLVIHCLDAATGKPLWKRNLIQEHAGRNIGWKNAASVAVDGDLVFVAGGGAGQSLLGLNKRTGEVAWKAFDETITHATPVVATILGQRQVIFFLKSGLLAVSPGEGKELWRFPFKFNVSTAASPVVWGDVVFCSAGYNVGGGACRIVREGEGFTAKELWVIPGNKQVANHWSTPVCKDGYLYGMFGFKQFKNGPLKCVEVATGKVQWAQPGFGQGNVILAGDKLLALTDEGQLVVAAASPSAYQELARTQAVEGKCWSTPALSDGRVYIRSVKQGVCLDLNGK